MASPIGRAAIRLLAAGLLLALGACAINRPTVTQLAGDPALFMLAHPLRYGTNDGKYEIVVPEGFITDLASIPRYLWWWQAPHEAAMAPAIIHDYLYWLQPCTKEEADAVLYLALLEVGVEKRDARAVYFGVRTAAAQRAWEENRSAREGGESRFLTERYARVVQDSGIDARASLASIEKAAAAEGALYQPAAGPAVKRACEAAMRQFDAKRFFGIPG